MPLGPPYEMLAEYLGSDRKYGDRVREMADTWQKRVDAGDRWPVFAVKRDDLTGEPDARGS